MSRLFLASSEPGINFVRAFLSLETRLSHGQPGWPSGPDTGTGVSLPGIPFVEFWVREVSHQFLNIQEDRACSLANIINECSLFRRNRNRRINIS